MLKYAVFYIKQQIITKFSSLISIYTQQKFHLWVIGGHTSDWGGMAPAPSLRTAPEGQETVGFSNDSVVTANCEPYKCLQLSTDIRTRRTSKW